MTSTQEQAQEAAAQAKDKAGQAAEQARGQAREQVDQRSTQAGERVSAQAADVRAVASALRDQGKDQPAKLAEQAADRAEKLGSYLQDADADRLLGDIEDLGRRQPMAVIFGGLALGFAASRFVKASSQERYAASPGGTRPYTGAATDELPPPAPGPTFGVGVGEGAYPGAAPPVPADTGLAPDTRFPEPALGEERTGSLPPRAPSEPLPPAPPSANPVWGR